jgi:hypothetical protein
MKPKKTREISDHSGSTFDSFLEEEGVLGEVHAVAIKRVRAWQKRVEFRSTGQPRAAVPTKARKP